MSVSPTEGKSRKCYLAGPMRSKPSFNFPAFIAGEALLRATGWEVFNPAAWEVGTTDLNLTIEQQRALAGDPNNTRAYAKRDCLVIIDNLRMEDGDAVVVLPDWETSAGARAEVSVARWVGLPIIPLMEAIR